MYACTHTHSYTCIYAKSHIHTEARTYAHTTHTSTQIRIGVKDTETGETHTNRRTHATHTDVDSNDCVTNS